MTREEAHRLLDAARTNLSISERSILAALQATGDLSGDWQPTRIQIQRANRHVARLATENPTHAHLERSQPEAQGLST